MANVIDTSEPIPSAPRAMDIGTVIQLGGAQSVGTIQAGPFKNFSCKGIKVVANITAVGGTSPTLTVTIQGYDVASNTFYTLLASASIIGTGHNVLTVYPTAVAVTNVLAADVLPENWAIACTFGGTSPSFTGTVSACFLP